MVRVGFAGVISGARLVCFVEPIGDGELPHQPQEVAAQAVSSRASRRPGRVTLPRSQADAHCSNAIRKRRIVESSTITIRTALASHWGLSAAVVRPGHARRPAARRFGRIDHVLPDVQDDPQRFPSNWHSSPTLITEHHKLISVERRVLSSKLRGMTALRPRSQARWERGLHPFQCGRQLRRSLPAAQQCPCPLVP